MRIIVESLEDAVGAVQSSRDYMLSQTKGHCAESCQCNNCWSYRKLRELAGFMSGDLQTRLRMERMDADQTDS